MLTFGFPPAAPLGAKVLVLGTLPGPDSLERSEYYANPQNAFWRILAGSLASATFPTAYTDRVALLAQSKIALWDVLASATRRGGLDASIQDDAVPNNFLAFFNIHPDIRLIGFNGLTAEKLYGRYVLPTLTQKQSLIERRVLPSTSGANARMSFSDKAKQWSVIWEHAG